jgi:hypothetical protein
MKTERIRRLIRIFVLSLVFVHIAMAAVFISHEFFNFTSSNSAIYVLEGRYGGIEIKRDLLLEEADRLIFMLDANCVFNFLMRSLAIAKREPILELSWDSEVGVGGVKQFRSDGSMLSLCFSRFESEGKRPQGLFLGGDLPYGDTSRANDHNSSGFGYYDGEDWHHIWCVSNEGIKVLDEKPTVVLPTEWKYLGSKVLKNTEEEVILESDHELVLKKSRIQMKRFVSFRAGEDYFILKVRFTNIGSEPVVYGYSWGDEPWVGHYGASRGDVGWYADGLIKTETLISPTRYRYVGYWDYGNDAAGESHNFSGYANFVEWISPTPSFVFLSNSIERCCNESVPLSSSSDRVISIGWLNQLLLPGESRDYTLAIGMARVNPKTGMPQKPALSFN